MNKYTKFWTCPKCGSDNPDLRWFAAIVIGGDEYSIEVLCWKCGYYEIMHTLDYKEKSSDTV